MRSTSRFAYIFDFDGVIADSMPILFDSYNAAFRPHGFTMSWDLFLSMAGRPPIELISSMCIKNNCADKAQEITRKYYENYKNKLKLMTLAATF